MPAALYPKNKKGIFTTRTQTIPNPEEIAAPLLCDECEQRFNRNGEDEVLRWIAPKAKKGRSPLATALRTGTAAFTEAGQTCYWGRSLGLSPEKFAYFGLSLVWRASACDWRLPDGNRVTRLDLKEYSEPVRVYLAGEGPFPADVHVMVTVCTDERSQEYWMPPTRSGELGPMVMMSVLGVMFRFWFGRVLPVQIDGTIFFPDPANPIFTAHCWDVLRVVLSELVSN